MPTLSINGNSQDFAEDKRLVLAIKEMGINIGHRCGGQGKCTTCRVEFVSGEPAQMTKAEYEKLKDNDENIRLSCQLTCSQDMEVKALMTLENQEAWSDTGGQPADEVVPEAVWYGTEELANT